MKKIILLAVLLSVVEATFSQEEKSQYIRKGLIRSMGTISPGILLKENSSTISLYGTLEGYVSDNISIRGDSYYDILSAGNKTDRPFQFNHSTFSGASYHFKTKNHFDPYFSFAPGISITKAFKDPCPPNIYCTNEITTFYKSTANPLLSFSLGFNFYFQRWFHLFGEARYISGKYLSDRPTPLSLNELKFAFGLGLNINARKRSEERRVGKECRL